MTDVATLVEHAAKLLDRIETLLPEAIVPPDWSCAAFRWRKSGQRGFLQSLPHPQRQEMADLLCVDGQKAEIERNTRQFISGKAANNRSGILTSTLFPPMA